MQLLDEYSVSHINLLQVDVEGYDAEVVKMLDFPRIKPSIIKYELCSLTDSTQKDLKAILRKQGYKTFKEHCDYVAILKV
uniref:Methyltransferase FkbM domain-containing protein n=1 Tax=Candidatus Kentrum sp. TC TaxID=2126339 RepID=A0A450YES4_9GAMM|nr:MAG: Methyltransferase FkbM domain-containing protein [Candidatus Kentron sp. TC]VFK46317.1 MAG: Methyltransferase FkbM domain-containing protein [Candidatus Kentron sp. TC]VFK55931.1 MAG: Methyltransferase FkbM domain-containing protein [Candidatus Kentron sp. TC]